MIPDIILYLLAAFLVGCLFYLFDEKDNVHQQMTVSYYTVIGLFWPIISIVFLVCVMVYLPDLLKGKKKKKEV